MCVFIPVPNVSMETAMINLKIVSCTEMCALVHVVSGMGTSAIIVDRVMKQMGSKFTDPFMRDPRQECPG